MLIILRILLFLTFSKKVLTRNPPGLVIPESDHSQPNDYYQSNHKEICGIRKIIGSRQRRIVGGKKSSFGEWPWQVSIIKVPNWEVAPVDFDGFGNDRGDCGGALLTRNWIITAAHCVDGRVSKNSQFIARIGEHDFHDLSYGLLPHQDRIISEIIIHRNHVKEYSISKGYDIALLKMARPIDFKPNAIPICLPRPYESFNGQTGFATGWGNLFEKEFYGRSNPKILREVQLEIISNEKCVSVFRTLDHKFRFRAYPFLVGIPKISALCAGWKNEVRGACAGDSGGPLVVKSNYDDRYTLAGITSGGIQPCGSLPTIFTKVSQFTSWVIQNTDY